MKIVILFGLFFLSGCSTTNQNHPNAVTELRLPSSLKTFVYSQGTKGYWVDITLTDEIPQTLER